MYRRLLWSFSLELNAASCGDAFFLLLAADFDSDVEEGFVLDGGIVMEFVTEPDRSDQLLA